MGCFEECAQKKAIWQERGRRLNDLIYRTPYIRKVELSRELIKGALDEHGDKPVVSSSFGKDSMALTHLVHSVDPSVPVQFTKTGAQYPQTIQYMKEMKRKYGLKIIELSPEKTFFEIVKQHGYPKESRNSKTGDKREPACCRILKFKPFEDFVGSYRPTLNFTGLLGDEGRQRRMPYIVNGSGLYHMKALDIMRCIPLIWWTGSDVWQYHDENRIPRNPVYERYRIERTGCIPCTGHKGWEEQLARTFPKLYAKIQADKGQEVFILTGA